MTVLASLIKRFAAAALPAAIAGLFIRAVTTFDLCIISSLLLAVAEGQ
jgi:hypothetical protein